jgi:hypothetical protein
MKEVDVYDRCERSLKKKVADDKVRAMLSSNVEQSIIPADLSKPDESYLSVLRA